MGNEKRGDERRGDERRGETDLTWSVCWMPTSVHVAHQLIVYHTSIIPSYSLHIRTLHRLRPPPLPHSQSLQSLVLRGSVHMYVCEVDALRSLHMYVSTYIGR